MEMILKKKIPNMTRQLINILLLSSFPLLAVENIPTSSHVVEQVVCVLDKHVLTFHDLEIYSKIHYLFEGTPTEEAPYYKKSLTEFSKMRDNLIEDLLVEDHIDNSLKSYSVPSTKINDLRSKILSKFQTEASFVDFLNKNKISENDLLSFLKRKVSKSDLIQNYLSDSISPNSKEPVNPKNSMKYQRWILAQKRKKKIVLLPVYLK